MQEQNINAVIDHLAAKLSVPAAHLWGVLQRQVFMDAMQYGLWALLFLGAVVGFLTQRKRLRAWKDEDSYENAPWVVVCHIAAVALLCAGLGCTIGFVARAINPEYYALSDILSALK